MNLPSVGRVVLVQGVQANANGATVAPALITRVWNDGMINCTVLPDASAPVPATSVRLFDTEADATAAQAESGHPFTVAYWPPRI